MLFADGLAAGWSHVALQLHRVLVLDAIDRLHSQFALEMFRMDYLSLGSGVALNDLWLLPEPAGAEDEEVDCFGGLLRIAVLRELAEAIDELNEDLFQQLEVVADGMFE